MEKKSKRPNFSDKETEMLLTEIGKNSKLLVFSTLDKSSRMNKMKRGVWEEIATKINAVFRKNRCGQSVAKRWKDLKDAIKNKDKYSREPPSAPVQYEDWINKILREESVIVDGTCGGCDTMWAKHDATAAEKDGLPLDHSIITVDLDSNPSQLLEGGEDGGGTQRPQTFRFSPSVDHPAVLTSNAGFKITSTSNTRNQKRKRLKCVSNEQDYMKTYSDAATRLVQSKKELLKCKTSLVKKISRKTGLESELLEQQKMKADLEIEVLEQQKIKADLEFEMLKQQKMKADLEIEMLEQQKMKAGLEIEMFKQKKMQANQQ